MAVQTCAALRKFDARSEAASSKIRLFGRHSRSPLPRLRHPSDRRVGHRAALEDHADPRTGALHALQGLLGGARLSVQAQSSGGASAHEDFGERSAVVLVAGRAVANVRGQVREVEMRVPWELWDQVWDRDNGFCKYCSVDLAASFNLWMSATVDHVIAVSAGGPSNIENLVLCCSACNSMLSRSGDLQTFEERRSFLEKRRPDFERRYQTYRRK